MRGLHLLQLMRRNREKFHEARIYNEVPKGSDLCLATCPLCLSGNYRKSPTIVTGLAVVGVYSAISVDILTGSKEGVTESSYPRQAASPFRGEPAQHKIGWSLRPQQKTIHIGRAAITAGFSSKRG